MNPGFPAIDGLVLDPSNPEFNNAAALVETLHPLIFLTGKAGTGKTTFLKYIRETCHRNTVVLAPTGVAAINAGGMTLHSFFNLPLRPFIPEDPGLSDLRSKGGPDIFSTFRYRKQKLDLLRSMQLLVIDEVSMVRCDTLDVIDRVLRVFRNKKHLPFGGVQVVLIGDNFQLPPAVGKEEKDILRQFYPSVHFFSARVIREGAPVYIELKKIYRQKEQAFIDLLNRVRIGQVSPQDLRILDTRLSPHFQPDREDYITLCTHNIQASQINARHLEQLEGDIHAFEAVIKGEFPEKSRPTDEELELKVGAQVMFVKNDPEYPRQFHNGKLGRILAIEEERVRVQCEGGESFIVERLRWENIRYTFRPETRRIEEEVVGTFEQLPLKLAWAITVHKSQGLTFERVIADLSQAFTAGQVYVALSRCTSLEGLVLLSRVSAPQIIVDQDALEYARRETPETLILRHIQRGMADRLSRRALALARAGDFVAAWDAYLQASAHYGEPDHPLLRRFLKVFSARYKQREAWVQEVLTARKAAKKEKAGMQKKSNAAAGQGKGKGRGRKPSKKQPGPGGARE
ncbi:MAG TPA: DEAD/DEAH box helicase [Bacteroidales bacterium]|nr:DEAD/DEAH box helicase [Bacteroidales bacterium]HRZ76300.1 DEAD/DEAH box helicase [Bacteroidales bacterium]